MFKNKAKIENFLFVWEDTEGEGEGDLGEGKGEVDEAVGREREVECWDTGVQSPREESCFEELTSHPKE